MHLISDHATYYAAMAEITSAIDSGDARRAIWVAENARAAADLTPLLRQLRAFAFTEAGGRLGDRDLVERGAVEWRAVGDVSTPTIAYNVANARLAAFEIDLDSHGYERALLDHRGTLETARSLYDQVGRTEAAPVALRVQSLTNSANAFDLVSRDLEALRRYDEAIALDPAFGMALGNRAITLAHYANYHDHPSMLLALAAHDLDAALEDRERVYEIGGAQALSHFEEVRSGFAGRPGSTPTRADSQDWDERHARWCYERELFLHVSHHCLRPEDVHYDPLFFRGFTGGLDDSEERRAEDLVDALNTLKQEYVSARYLTWLSIDEASPIMGQAREIAARVPFHNSLLLARWGARTGLAFQALTAATNLLDKIAAFLHLYFRTGRPRQQVYFRGFWKAKQRKGEPVAIEPAFARHLPESRHRSARNGGNLGLLALVDLSRDLDGDTVLADLLALRHAATHRFLVAHHGAAPPSSEWLERLEWTGLKDVMLEQLAVARAALIYLVRTINSHEAGVEEADRLAGHHRLETSITVVDPSDAEID
jgi:hypothetical protein